MIYFNPLLCCLQFYSVTIPKDNACPPWRELGTNDLLDNAFLPHFFLLTTLCASQGILWGEIRSSQRRKQLLWARAGSVPSCKHEDPDSFWKCCCEETAEAWRLLWASPFPHRADLRAVGGHQGSLSTARVRRVWEEISWEDEWRQQISASGTQTSAPSGPLT